MEGSIIKGSIIKKSTIKKNAIKKNTMKRNTIKRNIIKRRVTKLIALICAVLLITGSLAGCGNDNMSNRTEGSTGESDSITGSNIEAEINGGNEIQRGDTAQLSGTILMVGSTSMETFVTTLAEGYMELHRDVTVNTEFVGSGAGIEAVLNGTADIGNSSRNLKDEEKTAGAVENIVAIEGIAVCVDSDNTVSNLTKQQLVDIYIGMVTNWSQVGGADSPIVVVGREAGSGTRNAFEELLGARGNCVYANVLDSAGAVMAKVASTPGAIGYVSLDMVNDSVVALQLNGVAPSVENIKTGSYLLYSPFVMATMGDISEQSELIQDWFEYVLGEEGQGIASSVGLITVESNTP